jgi:hypothetical protein
MPLGSDSDGNGTVSTTGTLASTEDVLCACYLNVLGQSSIDNVYTWTREQMTALLERCRHRYAAALRLDKAILARMALYRAGGLYGYKICVVWKEAFNAQDIHDDVEGLCHQDRSPLFMMRFARRDELVAQFLVWCESTYFSEQSCFERYFYDAGKDCKKEDWNTLMSLTRRCCFTVPRQEGVTDEAVCERFYSTLKEMESDLRRMQYIVWCVETLERQMVLARAIDTNTTENPRGNNLF